MFLVTRIFGNKIFFLPQHIASRNHATELPTASDIICRWNWKGTFDSTEMVNNHWLKSETVHHIVRFISHFALKLHIQFWKYFHSIVLYSISSSYFKNYT